MITSSRVKAGDWAMVSPIDRLSLGKDPSGNSVRFCAFFSVWEEALDVRAFGKI